MTIATVAHNHGEMIRRAQFVKGRSLWIDAGRRLMRNKPAVASILLLTTIAALSIVVPLIWPYSYAATDFNTITCAPDWWPDRHVFCTAGGLHVFGTDSVGRD